MMPARCACLHGEYAKYLAVTVLDGDRPGTATLLTAARARRGSQPRRDHPHAVTIFRSMLFFLWFAIVSVAIAIFALAGPCCCRGA